MPNQPTLNLYWIPESVANVLHVNGIHDHSGLAAALAHAVHQSTVYRAFPNKDWSGRAPQSVLVAMARTFGVPLNRLVAEPAADRVAARRKRTDEAVAS